MDQSLLPIVQKKEKLLKSWELLVGMVDVSVSADFGRYWEGEKEDYLYLCSYFLLCFRGAFMPTLVLKNDGSPINGYVFSSLLRPALALSLSSASVSLFC